MVKDFIKELMTEINKVKTCYYEKVPANASYPYCVVPQINITPLEQGNMCYFDIEVYINELSDLNIEDVCDELLVLDRLSVVTPNISFHLAFEGINTKSYNEQDEHCRIVNFSARIFN